MELRRQGIINSSPHLVSLSDSGILSFDTDMKSKVKECTVHFSPVQAAGTPAPDNVLPISGWTGVTGYRAGVNLCDIGNPLFTAPKESQFISYNSYINNGVLMNGGIVGTANGSGLTFSVVAGCNYTISFIPGGESANYTIVAVNIGSNNVWLNYAYVLFQETTVGQRKCITFTFPSGYTHVYFAGFSATKYGSWESEIQLEVGTTPTLYTPYTGTAYPVTFPAVGKNKFDITQLPYHENPTTTGVWNTDNNTIKVIASASSGGTAAYKEGHFRTLSELAPNLEVGQTYFLSFTSTGSQKQIYLSISANTWGSGTQRTITQNDLDSIVYFYASGTSTEATITNFQIEAGTAATTYEPYTNTIYGGYVDLVSGELIATWLGKKISEFAWSYSTYNSANAFRTDDSLDLLGSSSEQGVICSTFASEPMVVNYASSENKPNHTIYRLYTSVERRIFIKCTEYTSVSDFLAAYGNEEIAYKLATPITYLLTPQQLSILKGANNVWSNANGAIDLSFWAHKEPNGGLPLEYRRVEWLQSDGNQYIDLNISITNDMSIFATVLLSSVYTRNTNIACFGGRVSATQSNVQFNLSTNADFVFDYGSYEINRKIFTAITDQFIDIKLSNNILIVNGVSQNITPMDSLFATPKTYLFDCYNKYSGAGWIGKIACFKLGTVRNCIPCVRKSDDKPGMYDTVTDTFYTNAGTGEFIVPN